MLGNAKAIETALGEPRLPTKWSGFRISIRWVIFTSLMLVSVLPILGLYKWMERSAIQKEIAYVDENHLIIANNLAAAMERYANDVASVFELTISNLEVFGELALSETLDVFDLSFVTVVDANDTILNEVRAVGTTASPRLSFEQMAGLRAQAAIDPGQTVFSGVLQFDGAPHLFLARSQSDGRLAFAALKLRYLVELQKSIEFGILGHSMIVDQNGLVIAHPNPEWQATSKDASGLSVVRQMMSGKTGVALFYSPPMQAEMISGFTFVVRTGWGVMVPQPMSELVARAKVSQSTALAIVFFEVCLLVLLSWWLSRLISTPIQHFVTMAEAVSGGDLAARVDVSDAKVVISEAQLLGASFNKVISDLQADRSQMTNALDAALKGERAKSQFLTVMSHEVRTPMHGLMGVLELIEGGTTDDDQRYLLTVGQKAANDMVRLLDDALLFAKLEANAQKSEVSKFNLADVVKSAIELFHPLASQKGLSLTSTVSDQMLRGDPQSISQILLNLVGNAVKFTTEGKIHIAAELGSDGFGADRLILSVSDSGIGIAKGAQATIFEDFYQVDSELSRTNKGSGLGLAISWRLARLMKGEISLTSEPSIGSCFQLSIPVCVVEV